MPKIEIEYDGEYPNLCSGTLVVYVDGERYNFGNYALRSDGSCYIDDNFDEAVTKGDWIVTFPKGFPKELEDAVTAKVNEQIEHGCCGGCL